MHDRVVGGRQEAVHCIGEIARLRACIIEDGSLLAGIAFHDGGRDLGGLLVAAARKPKRCWARPLVREFRAPRADGDEGYARLGIDRRCRDGGARADMPDDDTCARRDDAACGSLSACCIALVVGGNNADRLAVGDGAARPDVADRQLYARSDRCGRIAGGIRRANGSNNEIRAAYTRAAKREPTGRPRRRE